MKIFQNSMVLSAALFAITPANAALTFEDAATGIAFDLPEGYLEQSRQHKVGTTIFNFGAENRPDLIVSVIPIETGFDDNAEIFETLMQPIEEAFGGPTTTRELSELEIDGMPATWGWMERSISDSVVMIAGVGVIEMDDNQVAFSLALSETDFVAMRRPLESSFLSIREAGQSIGVVSNRVAVERAAAEITIVEPSIYEHPLFALDLPAGWQATTNSTEAKAINMATLNGPTGNVTIICMSGMLANRKTVEQAIYGSLSNNQPNLNQVGTEKSKAKNGKKAEIKWYKAQTETQGSTILLDALTATVKNGKCMLGFVAFSPESPGDQRVNEIMGIVKSVH